VDRVQRERLVTIPVTLIVPVPGWYAVGPKILVGAGIASAEVFGTPFVAYLQPIALTSGIASAEAFGTPTVGRGAVQLVPTGIPSAEAFGTPRLSSDVKPTGIASAEAFGTPAMGVGPVDIAAGGILSGEEFGTPKITSNVVVGAGIPSAEAFGTPTVTKGPVNILVSGIASAEAFGTTTVETAIPVLFDALGSGNSSTSTNSLSWSHTATPGATVLVWVLYYNGAGVGSIAATYAGQNMKLEANYYAGYVSGYEYLACFSYPAALAGPQTIALSFGYTGGAKANSLSYLNANQLDAVKIVPTATGTALSVPNVQSAARHMVANAMAAMQSAAAQTAYNKTSRWNIVTGAWAISMLLGDAPGAAPDVSFNSTASPSGYWCGQAIDMCNVPVPIINTAVPVQANTIALPPHAIGDIIVIAACDYNVTTPSSKPAAGGTVPAWVDIDANAGANACSMRTAYFVATANNHTSGAWGSTTYLAAVVLRGQKAGSPIGGHAEAGGTGTTGLVAPAITLAKNDGSSQILCFHFARNVVLDAAPVGYTRRGISSSNNWAISSKIDTTTDGATTVTTAGASVGWRAAQIEILR
jgi:hypothetical protein